MNHYAPPLLLFNKHIETIYPSLFRNVAGIEYLRERISTPDKDFLDLDWLKKDSRKLVILSHGLEGNSQRSYIKGMAKIFFAHGFDVLAWNYRGCSGEMNHTLRFYHSGATEDLGHVIEYALAKKYDEINLIGFSLGGNLTLKYLGEMGNTLDKNVKNAVVFSVPLNLYTSCQKISERMNWVYSQRFLKSLKEKVLLKSRLIPGIDASQLAYINSLIEFDNAYTAPLHGFKNAIDYYNQCSSIHFLNQIQRPTLIVNAKNDPFLSEDCYPQHLKEHTFVKVHYPKRGGHVGFALFNQNGLYWSEQRALHFILHQQ